MNTEDLQPLTPEELAWLSLAQVAPARAKHATLGWQQGQLGGLEPNMSEYPLITASLHEGGRLTLLALLDGAEGKRVLRASLFWPALEMSVHGSRDSSVALALDNLEAELASRTQRR